MALQLQAIKAGQYIKPDPESGSPPAPPPAIEEDADESGDVDFWNPQTNSHASTMYIARVPHYVWKAWAEMKDDGAVQVGRIRQWQEQDPKTGELRPRLQMLLDSNNGRHQNIPKEYNLDITNAALKNTYIFSEKDLPSYAAKNKERTAALARGIPAHILRKQQQKQQVAKDENESSSSVRDRHLRLPNVRRAVPKKTKIVGRVKHEIVATPLDNAETDFLMAKYAHEAQQPKHKLAIVNNVSDSARADSYRLDTLIKVPAPISKAKKLELKTARWPENKLLDALAGKFSQFRYWGLKELRHQIPQPEAFIRECLEKIAVLYRNGPFANKWGLKPEFQHLAGAPQSGDTIVDNAVAPEVAAVDSDSDTDVDMEDVALQ